MAIEEPPYIVESTNDRYEIRKYESIIVAEMLVDAGFEDAGSRAFKILAGFIFGNNQSQQKISMTAPVNQHKADDGYLVQFTMPAKFTIESLPKANDQRVKTKVLPAKKVAVIRYSGRWTESNYKEHLEELKKALQKDGVPTAGEPILCRYNSPFTPWFLRRNEIWIEIPQSSK